MSIELFTLLMFGSFFLLLAVGVPLSWSCLGIAAVFGLILKGTPIFQLLLFRTYDMMLSFNMAAIPLFIFMAVLLRYSGVANDLYDAIYIWLGSFRGGLAITSVLVCTIVAAMVGVGVAGITIMGIIALPAMLQHKYDKGIALGSICAGGTLGLMIPPSIMFIIYGVNAGESIGKLFMGGIGPGLVLSALYCLYIGIRASLQPRLCPAMPEEERVAVSLLAKLSLFRSLILPCLLILIVLGSIYLGWATPGEAAGIGAFGALVIVITRRRLTWSNLKESVYSTLSITGMIFWIVFGAYAFIGVYTLAGGSDFIRELIAGLPFGPWGILMILIFILIIMGMVFDLTGIIILTVPIFVPLIKELGFDPLWFGVLFNITLQIAFISPPFGYGMFCLKAVTPPEITMTDIYKAVIPFILLQVIGLSLCMLFPQIIMWLPNQMIR